MTEPKVSVIVCTYNQQDIVRETLDSVVHQDYANLEVIVTDDGSPDLTPQVLQEYRDRYPDRVRIVLHNQNTGIPNNINRGLAIRTGEYVAWLDGDDLMLPGKISRQVQFMLAHPDVTGCYHDAEIFESASGRTLGRASELYNGTTALKQGGIEDWLQPRYYLLPSTVMARSSACPAHGFDERLKHLSELLFFAEVFHNSSLLAIPDVLVRYRRHANNITANPAARLVSQEYELIVYAILEARYPNLHDLVKRRRTACLLTEALRLYRDEERQQGNVIVRNVMRDGDLVKAALVWITANLPRQWLMQLTGGQPFTRSPWIKKIARFLLK